MAIATELPIDTGASATDMANTIFGDGVTVVSASYTGDALSSGIYSNGDAVSPGATPADTGIILSTGRAADFTNNSGTTNTNTSNNTTTNTSGPSNDPDFNAIAGIGTQDASFMEVDFIPTGDMIALNFVMASEEYPEWIGSQYNDVMGVWVNGVQATVTIGDGSASVGNLNGADTLNLYQDNLSDQFNTEMDGFTITLSFQAPVTPGVVNSIKFGIADVGDSQYDSNILIGAGQVQSARIAVDDDYDVATGATRTLRVLENDTGSGTLTITHINGVPVTAGDTITLPTGQTVTLNADGTFTFVADGDTEEIDFTYRWNDGTGDSNEGNVTVNQAPKNTLPCFATGTLIATARGEIPVEEVIAGDRLVTLDAGLQVVRWVGRVSVPRTRANAPVRFDRGTLGASDPLEVSPQHRILLRDARAELLFGQPEVLIAARHLIDGSSITQDLTPPTVTYHHLLLDHHHLILSNGIWSESYHPGPETLAGFDAETQQEILALFPELDPQTGRGYSGSARMTLKAFEARLVAPVPKTAQLTLH